MMSLSSLLLEGKTQTLDEQLDSIFQSTAPQPPLPKDDKKRKRHEHAAPPPNSKKSKVSVEQKADTTTSNQTKTENKRRKKRKHEETVIMPESVEEETNRAGTSSLPATTLTNGEEMPDDPEATDSEPLIHESLLQDRSKLKKGGTNEGVRIKKTKYVPPDESHEQHQSRTIFVGNVSSETVKSRPLLKQFKRHILSFVPTARIESVRFRSIAFQQPTTKLPTDEDDSTNKSSQKPARKHDVDRVSSWQTAEVGTVAAEKKFLTPKEKKRVAYIKHDFHDGVDVVTAYVVFAHPQPPGERAPNVPSPAAVMDPHEAARLAVEKCDGSVFNQKTLRVDHVHSVSSVNGDPKLSVFVGNLDFASKEEDLRAFFESLITAERGPRDQEPDQASHDPEGGAYSSTWVTRVRIIRDKDTQLGKGFAYVQFADRECVDEILALDQDNIKFAKRKLRVQRCKTIIGSTNGRGGTNLKTHHALPESARSQPTPTSVTHIPKGDPNLGKQLEHLSKEDRKKRKASDADRIARRLAKKKVKTAMDKAGAKAQIKERERIRTRRATDPKKVTKPKRRVRSEPNLRNRNLKK